MLVKMILGFLATGSVQKNIKKNLNSQNFFKLNSILYFN